MKTSFHHHEYELVLLKEEELIIHPQEEETILLKGIGLGLRVEKNMASDDAILYT